MFIFGHPIEHAFELGRGRGRRAGRDGDPRGRAIDITCRAGGIERNILIRVLRRDRTGRTRHAPPRSPQATLRQPIEPIVAPSTLHENAQPRARRGLKAVVRSNSAECRSIPRWLSIADMAPTLAGVVPSRTIVPVKTTGRKPFG